LKIRGLIAATVLVYSLQGNYLSEVFKEVKVDGELRVVHFSRTADDSYIFSKAQGTAVGGNIGLTIKPTNNFKVSARFYTTQPINADDELMPSTYLVDGTKGYSILGEANLAYDNKIFKLKVGRQALKTPLIASQHDARVIKGLFEAVSLSTTLLSDTILHALYIHRNSGMDNGSSNYNHDVSAKNFVSMSKTLGTTYDKGMAVVGLENKYLEGLKLNAWYYYGIELIDMFYLDASYAFKVNDVGLKLEGHYWDIKSQSEYEEDTGKKIDYNYGGIRGTVGYSDFILQFAREQINYKNETHGIQTAWGMYSGYTFGSLIGSGIYGALNGIGGKYLTQVDASKITFIYNFTEGVMLSGSYNWWIGGKDDFQSDINVADILVEWPSQVVDNGKWQLIYENWDSKSENIMVDNNLVRAKFTYTF